MLSIIMYFGSVEMDNRKRLTWYYDWDIHGEALSSFLILLLLRSPIRFNAHWIQLCSVVASPNTVTMRIDAHYFQSTYVCGLRNSVRFDSVCLCSNGALHNSVQFCTVMSHVMYHVISSSAVCKELIQKEAY